METWSKLFLKALTRFQALARAEVLCAFRAFKRVVITLQRRDIWRRHGASWLKVRDGIDEGQATNIAHERSAGILKLAEQGLSNKEIADKFKVTRSTASNYRAQFRVKPGAPLTVREQQVSEAAGKGLTNKVIALRLGLSPRTVELYRLNALKKLEAGNAAELATKHRDKEREVLLARIAELETEVAKLQETIGKLRRNA